MSNVRLLKRRIRSAHNIGQITKAMEMVAASKMKRAQMKALEGKPYAQKIYQILADLASRMNIKEHPLFISSKMLGKKVLIILITTNKGLCGSLNTNLFRALNKWFFQKGLEVDFVAIGKKGAGFIVKEGYNLIADFSQQGLSFVDFVPAVVKLISDRYLQKEYRQIYLLYNDFISALSYQPKKLLILPMEFLEREETGESGVKDQKSFNEFIIEPSSKEIFEPLLFHYLEVEVRTAILQAEASEHSARMVAMKSATDNASVLMEELTLEYNKLRQEAITYEIADIVTARLTVEK